MKLIKPRFITNHHFFSSIKTYINGHNKRPNGRPLVSPPIKNHDPYKRMILGQPIMPTYKSTTKFQHYTNTNHHPRCGASGCQTLILPALYPSPKTPQSTRHMPTIHRPYMQHDTDDNETMKGIFWSIKFHVGISIAIGAFAEMDHLPDFDEIMVDHPALLVPQKIPVDEDAILPYFPNLMDAVPGKLNATPFFVMAHNIPFHELQDRVALHIWPHSINISLDPTDTPMTSQMMIHFVTLK
jgi:hypothetical protein